MGRDFDAQKDDGQDEKRDTRRDEPGHKENPLKQL
jgi:hypothetical protein